MMRPPNPVTSVTQHRQQFGGQMRQPLQSFGAPQVTPEQQIQSQMHELALDIYSRLAVRHIDGDLYTQPLSQEQLRQLAEHSRTAAKAYFESMGVQFQEGQDNG